MPLTIESLLDTYPYKLKDCLEQMCDRLKLSKKGTNKVLRKRISSHVEENNDAEEKVREFAYDFRRKHPKSKPTHPLSPLVRITKQTDVGNQLHPHSTPNVTTQQTNSPSSKPFTQAFSQPDLFDDSRTHNNRRLSIAEVTKEIDELDEIFELEGIADNLIRKNQNINNDDDNEVDDDDGDDGDDGDDDDDDDDDNGDDDDDDDDVFPATEGARGHNVQHPITHIEPSFWYDNGPNDGMVETLIQSLQEQFNKAIGLQAKKHNKAIQQMEKKFNELNAEFHKKEKYFHKTVSKLSDEVRALRDKQPLSDPATYMAPLEIEVLPTGGVDPSTIEDIPTQRTQSNTKVLPANNETNLPEQRVETNTIEPPANKEPQQPKQPGQANKEPSANKEPTQSTPQDISDTIEKQNHILIVADSNGKHIDPKLIHDKKTVTIEKKYYLEDAMKIPDHVKPQNVTDVVMLTGINDLKYNSIPVVVGRLDKTCREYQRKFPKAIIHIGSVAPANVTCIQYNAHIQNLAAERGVPFISNDQMFNKTGHVQPGMIEKGDIHYTRKGIIPLAKQIKRSVYGYNEAKSQPRPNPLPNPSLSHPAPHQSRQQNIEPNQVFALRNLFNMALSYLPSY